jgi:hypothetical protein
VVAVPFPARPEDALESVFVFTHEVTGAIVSSVIADNTTPAQQRTGEAGTFVSFGQVQCGLMLLQRIAPELAEPYARYYLTQEGKPVPVATVRRRRTYVRCITRWCSNECSKSRTCVRPALRIERIAGDRLSASRCRMGRRVAGGYTHPK